MCLKMALVVSSDFRNPGTCLPLEQNIGLIFLMKTEMSWPWFWTGILKEDGEEVVSSTSC